MSLILLPVQVDFDYRDALNLESQLTEDERMMRDQVASYCSEKLMPRVLMANRNERKSVIMNINSSVQTYFPVVTINN